MSYTYRHPRPSITTDILIFSIRERKLQVLLIQRKGEPFAGAWAIPGGFIRMDEDLVDGALRELQEEAGVTDVPLVQFRTYGRPGRDPRDRVVTVVFMALIPSGHIVARAASDAADARWFPLTDLPALAFDHAEILADARRRLAEDVTVSVERTGRVAFDFLPAEFSLSQAQSVFEILRGEELDKRNFRKWLLSTWSIEETGGQTSGTGHRPAALYRLTAGTDAKDLPG